MKTLLSTFGKLLLLPVCFASFVLAQDDDAKSDSQKTETTQEDGTGKDSAKKAKEELSPVAQALAKLKLFNGKPNKKAKYYVYLQSASWCGPCCAEMPKIVAEYSKMRRAGIEIILVGCDKTEKEARAYLKSFRARFPGTMNDKKALSLPGFKPASGIPNAIFVDGEGKVLTSGHGSIIMDWKTVIDEK